MCIRSLENQCQAQFRKQQAKKYLRTCISFYDPVPSNKFSRNLFSFDVEVLYRKSSSRNECRGRLLSASQFTQLRKYILSLLCVFLGRISETRKRGPTSSLHVGVFKTTHTDINKLLPVMLTFLSGLFKFGTGNVPKNY